MLRFAGTRELGGAPAFLGSSAEPYRWRAAEDLEIARRDSDVGARFVGAAGDGSLRLRAEGASDFVPAGTVLTFTSAADNPIPDDWRTVLDFGPPTIRPVDPALADDPATAAAIQRGLAAEEPRRRRAAIERLARAWRAPA